MIQVAVYSGTGKFSRAITLDLAKSQVARRIEKGIAVGTHSHEDLVRLDSGAMSLSRLLTVYDVEDLSRALDRSFDKSADALVLKGDVDRLLLEWQAQAGGGEAAAPASPIKTIPAAAPPSKGTVSGVPLKKAGADIVKSAEAAWRRSGRS